MSPTRHPCLPEPHTRSDREAEAHGPPSLETGVSAQDWASLSVIKHKELCCTTNSFEELQNPAFPPGTQLGVGDTWWGGRTGRQRHRGDQAAAQSDKHRRTGSRSSRPRAFAGNGVSPRKTGPSLLGQQKRPAQGARGWGSPGQTRQAGPTHRSGFLYTKGPPRTLPGAPQG